MSAQNQHAAHSLNAAQHLNSAHDRLHAQRQMDASTLCRSTKAALENLANIMNQETMLLRTGHYQEAADLSEQKSQIAQEYVGLARVVQHQSARLFEQAPNDLKTLQAEHEKLATQMAENLRVLATAKTVSQNVLGDVAKSVGQSERPKTYAPTGQMSTSAKSDASGIAVNRSL